LKLQRRGVWRKSSVEYSFNKNKTFFYNKPARRSGFAVIVKIPFISIFPISYSPSFLSILPQSSNIIMNYWLVKSEPEKYSWEKFNKDGRTFWDGVRNYAARNNMRAMKEGDLVFFYHSNEGKEIVGIAKVVKEAYQDPTTDDTNWVVVELSPVEPLRNPVTLAQVKAEPFLKDLELVRLGRLSVSAVKPAEFDKILEMSR